MRLSLFFIVRCRIFKYSGVLEENLIYFTHTKAHTFLNSYKWLIYSLVSLHEQRTSLSGNQLTYVCNYLKAILYIYLLACVFFLLRLQYFTQYARPTNGPGFFSEVDNKKMYVFKFKFIYTLVHFCRTMGVWNGWKVCLFTQQVQF